MSLWSSMCFAFSGFEIASMVGQEVKNPRRTIPLGMLVAGVAVTGIYILSSASVLVAVPASELAERSGIADAVDLTTGRLGLAGMGALTGLLLASAPSAGTNSWVAGSARVPFAAGVDAVLPAAFARLHPRYRTPHVALIVQGLAATLLFLASVFVSLGGERDDHPGVVRHHGEPHHPDVLRALPLSVRGVDRAAPARKPAAGRDGDAVTLPGGVAGVWLIGLVRLSRHARSPSAWSSCRRPIRRTSSTTKSTSPDSRSCWSLIGFGFYAFARRRAARTR